MTLEPGRRFGPYEIKSPIGKGGMGEVFLAEDSRLGRKVAIKVLPAAHSADSGRRARFAAEARAASALNNPHIVTVHDVGSEGGVDYMVMEYIEGQTLRDLIAGRRLNPRMAFEIAAQVASGLAAAHAAGIVHRDIKPENIVIARDGSAKILDYGVAKLMEEPRDATDARTAARLTSPGSLVGTLSYMSPEQIEGGIVDHRSDIFALGTVLHEMLSGKNPFASSATSDTLQRILNAPPPPDANIRSQPLRVREILTRALERSPAERYQHAGDLELDLRGVIRAPAETSPMRRAPRSLVAAALLAGVLLGTVAILFVRRAAPLPKAERISFAPLTTDPGYEGEPTFSPDGQTIAYVSDRTGNLEIFLKQISGGPDINLTNDSADDVQPAFSPDGKQIAFVSTRASRSTLVFRNPTVDEMGGDIWVMSALGGVPRRVVERGNFPGWSADGSALIYVAGPWLGQQIYRVPSGGGEPKALPIALPTRPLFLLHPRFSPDGKWISFASQQPNNVWLVRSDGGRAVSVAHGSNAAWTPDSKAIIYSDLDPGRNATLSRLRIREDGTADGPATPLTSGRGEDQAPAISRDGKAFVFAAQTVSFNIERIAFDAERGRTAGVPEAITRGNEIAPFYSVSPDGRSIAFQSNHGYLSNIWRKDLDTGAISLLTSNEGGNGPEWSPDGKMIAFNRDDGVKRSVMIMRSDGADPRVVASGGGFVVWTPEGTGLAYFDFDHNEVRLLDLKTMKSRMVANEGAIRTVQKFSGDGKWLAYQGMGSNGLTEVRAVRTDGTGTRTLVSDWHENFHPSFAQNDRWLYYQPDHKNLFRIPGPAQGWKSAAPQQVTFFPPSNLYLEEPTFSRDGKYLYYSRRSIGSDLWLGRIE